jgi:hypothetical protein
VEVAGVNIHQVATDSNRVNIPVACGAVCCTILP